MSTHHNDAPLRASSGDCRVANDVGYWSSHARQGSDAVTARTTGDGFLIQESPWHRVAKGFDLLAGGLYTGMAMLKMPMALDNASPSEADSDEDGL